MCFGKQILYSKHIYEKKYCLTLIKNVSQNVRHFENLESGLNTGFFNNNIYNVLHSYITYIYYIYF